MCKAEDGIRELVRSRGLGDVYKRQAAGRVHAEQHERLRPPAEEARLAARRDERQPAVRQRTRIVIVKRSVSELAQPAAVGVDREPVKICLLYTSDAADERSSVDHGGRRIIKKKRQKKNKKKTINNEVVYLNKNRK